MSAIRLFVFSLVSLALGSFAISQEIETPQEIAKPAIQKIDGKIDWVYDYEKGKQLSDETAKPMFVVFRCER